MNFLNLNSERTQAIEQILVVATFTTFMGQIYFAPFGTEFRLTLAVVVLNVLMLTFKNLNPLWTINLVGTLMFLVRSSLHFLTTNASLTTSIKLYYPVFFFYSFYSIFFVLLKVREKLKRPLLLFLGIWFCDSIPNIVEALVRQEWLHTDFEKAILTIVTIGLFRTLFTVLLIYISNAYYDHIKQRQAHQRFRDSLLRNANLKTELFFLQKSKSDIEGAMQKSFTSYERIKTENAKLAEDLLEVAKDIHEIKKDYSRVISGLEKTLEDHSNYQMSFLEIVDIATSANKKVAELDGKTIDFKVHLMIKGRTEQYYTLLSVLNNLIINAVEAIETSGQISIRFKVEQSLLIISIHDTGCGIDSSEFDYIFKPGYATKYNHETGVMSSGIGLTHVKTLVEDQLDGQIEVESQLGQGTTFRLLLPIQSKGRYGYEL